jgi:tetratricopeptide (TPR) repeat protein
MSRHNKTRSSGPQAPVSDEPVPPLQRYGAAVCGLGMLAFAAAIAFWVTVRLGWWTPVQRGDPDEPAGKNRPAADSYAGSTDPVRRALGPLADDLSREQPAEFYISLGQRCSDAGELRLAARFYDVARRKYNVAEEKDEKVRADRLKKRIAVTRELARCLWDADRRTEAFGAVQEDIGLMGTDPRAFLLWQDYARMATVLGQVQDAVTAFHEQIRRAPAERERNVARRQLWQVWRSLERLPQILQLYESQLTADAGNDEALRMALACYLYVQPNPQRADELLERLIAASPADVELKEMRIQSLGALKRTDEMLRLVGEMTRAEPERAVFFREQAVNHLAAVGRLDEARSWVRDFLEKDTTFEGPSAAAKFYRLLAKEPAAAADQYAVARSRAGSDEVKVKLTLEEAECRIDAGQLDRAEALLKPVPGSAEREADRNRAGVLLDRIKRARGG